MLTNYANKVMDYEYNMFMSVMNVSVSKHLWDEHFTVLWANDYFYELIGYEKEEYTALFHNHVDEYFKDDPGAVAAMGEIIMAAYELKEQGYEFECQMPTKSGKKVWIRVTGRFTDEIHEGIPVIYTTYMDITDLKEMQIQMEEALKMAEQANRAKSDFLSRMSHDIRTPMNAIVGMTEIAGAHVDNPVKVKDCLKKIALSSQHLLGLINDVLDMSKIESGKMMPSIGSMYMPEIIENVVAILQPQVKDKEQQFDVRLHNVRHENFYSDALRLRQVFINILSNACKFTPKGGTITMDVVEEPSKQENIADFTFTFTDSGIGMNQEFIETIFDAFSREQDSRVDKTEGTGLGMAITKKIVDMLEGTISVSSEVGKGSVFTVRMPLQIENVEPEDVKLPKLRVLVTDDDEIACEYTVHVLEESGVCVDWTTSGYGAIEKACEAYQKGEDYDAVILDWKMPEIDGVQTARIMGEKTGGKLPIMMLSAYDCSEIEEDARAAGVSAFLQKPLFRSTLLHSLRRYVLGESVSSGERKWKKKYDFSGKTFLVVEDNELNMEIAQEIFSSVGAKVEYAYNGAEGVEKFTQSPEGYYDLILMDVQMPVMNGYTATRKLRELPRQDARSVPILAMTADAFAEDIEMAKESGMNGHLAKPLNMDAVNRTIEGFLNHNGTNTKGLL